MSAFLTQLWESIFTPGPTPTLLVATNATFACLQLLLMTLLIATYSVHFVVLSVLCAGLWWAINWFAREIAEAQKKEEEAKRIRLRRRESEKKGLEQAAGGAAEKAKVEGIAGGEGEGMDSGDDTETEIEQSGHLPPRHADDLGSGVGGKQERLGGFQGAGASTSGLAPLEDEALKKRRSIGESEGLSTDSEWEKVSEGER